MDKILRIIPFPPYCSVVNLDCDQGQVIVPGADPLHCPQLEKLSPGLGGIRLQEVNQYLFIQNILPHSIGAEEETVSRFNGLPGAVAFRLVSVWITQYPQQAGLILIGTNLRSGNLS